MTKKEFSLWRQNRVIYCRCNICCKLIDYSVITRVVNNYNIQINPRFFERNRTHSEPSPSFSEKPNWNRTEIKNLFRTSLVGGVRCRSGWRRHAVDTVGLKPRVQWSGVNWCIVVASLCWLEAPMISANTSTLITAFSLHSAANMSSRWRLHMSSMLSSC